MTYRVCDLCGGVDDGPRHVIAGVTVDAFPVDARARVALVNNMQAAMDTGAITVEDAVRLQSEFLDTTCQDRHMACCAVAGCPSETCREG